MNEQTIVVRHRTQRIEIDPMSRDVVVHGAGSPVTVIEAGPQGPQGLSGFSGKITVGPTAPLNPEVNDVWIDTT